MKKGRIYLLAFITLLTFSCNKVEQKIKYHWVIGKNSINPINRIIRQEKEDTTILSYFASRDTLNYYILESNKDRSFIYGSYEDGFLRQLLDTTITLNEKEYKVAKFIQNEEVIDGAEIHYYNPQIGVFAIHSNTWPGLQYLQSTDSIKNKLIQGLIKATVPEFHIRGNLKSELEKL